MNLFKIFNDFRNRLKNKQKYGVQVRIWSEVHNRYIGQLLLTTHAHSKAAAKSIIVNDLTMHVTDCWVVKDTHLNGTKQ